MAPKDIIAKANSGSEPDDPDAAFFGDLQEDLDAPLA
jgi:hypothetical protein